MTPTALTIVVALAALLSLLALLVVMTANKIGRDLHDDKQEDCV